MNDANTILENFSATLQQLAADGVWRIEGRVGRSRKCDIYIVGNPTHPAKLALKIYRSGSSSPRAPSQQFRALERLQKSDKSPAAPTPYGFSPEDRAILMDWIDAPSLQKSLWHHWWSSGQRHALIRSAGYWLRSFHDTTTIETQKLDGAKLVEKLNVQLEKHATQSSVSAAFQECIRVFARYAQQEVASTPHALLHGDFTPRNLLVRKKIIFGIDMWGARMGPTYEDAARLIAYILINSPFSLNTNAWHPLSKLQQAFADGYGTDQIDMMSKTWSLILLYQLLRRWLVYQSKEHQSPMDLVVGWQIKRAEKAAVSVKSWLEDCDTKI